MYDDFDYLLFTALMDTRDYLISIVQDRNLPMELRRRKLLACTHDFQLLLTKMSCTSGKISAHATRAPALEILFLQRSRSGQLPGQILSLTVNRSGKLSFPRWKSCAKDGGNISTKPYSRSTRHVTPKKNLPAAVRNSSQPARTGRSRKNSFSFIGSTLTSAEPSTMTDLRQNKNGSRLHSHDPRPRRGYLPRK